VQEPDNVWGFFSLSPEAAHQFVWLFGDRGIPASYRNMNGYSSHTFQWQNAKGEGCWAIKRGEYPSWTVHLQIMPFADAPKYRFHPFDLTKVWPHKDYPLQGRLFAYGDAHRYRLGINHTQIPVNRPRATTVQNYGRDGAMRFDGNQGRAKNYEPNSFGGPA
jgi:catalase